MSRLRGAFGSALLLVASPLLSFGVLEAAAWLAGVRPAAESRSYQMAAQTRRCQHGSGRATPVCDAVRRRSGDDRLILAFGGSSLQGHPYGERRTITHYLEARLNETAPPRYRVVNLGRACKNSSYVRACLERTLPVRPDLVLLYTGHNDFGMLMVGRPEAALLLQRHPWILDVDEALARTRTYALFQRLNPLAALRFEQAGALDDARFAHAQDVALRHLQGNLEAVAALTARAGVPVVVVTLVSNLYEFPLREAAWDDLAAFDPGSGARGERWRAHFARGIAAHRAGRPQEALRELGLARDMLPRGRAPGVANEAIRAFAAAHDHVHLVDFERELERLAEHEPIGCGFFGSEAYCDQLHPNPRTNRLIGEAVARKLREIEAARAPAAGVEPALPRAPAAGVEPALPGA
jgi:lysophospholipase L1-like esterase